MRLISTFPICWSCNIFRFSAIRSDSVSLKSLKRSTAVRGLFFPEAEDFALLALTRPRSRPPTGALIFSFGGRGGAGRAATGGGATAGVTGGGVMGGERDPTTWCCLGCFLPSMSVALAKNKHAQELDPRPHLH